MSKIFRVYEHKWKGDNVRTYRIVYASGVERCEVEDHLPETVKQFIAEKAAKCDCFRHYNRMFEVLEVIY